MGSLVGLIRGLLLFFGLLVISFRHALKAEENQKKGLDLNLHFLNAFSHWVRRIIGLKIESIHRDRSFLQKGAILIGNHQTGLDLAIISQVCAPNSVIVAKKELAALPLFGSFFKRAGNLFIDRSSKEASRKSLLDQVHALTVQKKNIAIFPEGTRKKDAALDLLPFKMGAFVLAHRAQVPIVPVVCSDLTGIAIWERLELKGGAARIHVLEPEYPPPTGASEDDVRKWMNDIREKMVQAFRAMRVL